jgi:hypothetical protein
MQLGDTHKRINIDACAGLNQAAKLLRIFVIPPYFVSVCTYARLTQVVCTMLD